jgi:hypothetical protein
MQKIISLFQRNYDTDRLVRNEVTPGAEWVLKGEGIATVKWDGTCCMIKDGVLYKRYDAKRGKTPPDGFLPAQEPDPITGHWPGWLKVDNGSEDKYHREAWEWFQIENGERFEHEVEGTYELIGPKINGNKHNAIKHTLISHSSRIVDAPRTYDDLNYWFAEVVHIEGVVWHHSDGRMVKIKKKDFGYKW